jgi:hypothetical protein
MNPLKSCYNPPIIHNTAPLELPRITPHANSAARNVRKWKVFKQDPLNGPLLELPRIDPQRPFGRKAYTRNTAQETSARDSLRSRHFSFENAYFTSKIPQLPALTPSENRKLTDWTDSNVAENGSSSSSNGISVYRQVALSADFKRLRSPLKLNRSISSGSKGDLSEIKENEVILTKRLKPSNSQELLKVPSTYQRIISSPRAKRTIDIIDGIQFSGNRLAKIKTSWGVLSVRISRPPILLPTGLENPKNILQMWANRPEVKNAIVEDLKKGTRIAYEFEDIAEALSVFEKYHCTWSELKHSFKNSGFESVRNKRLSPTKIMQIVHDLRSAYNSYIIEKIRKDFKNDRLLAGFELRANDFGSKTFGSDADLGFEFIKKADSISTSSDGFEITSSDLYLKQIEAVKAFNMEFERIWGHPSAIIFDTNAYTMLYINPANDPEIEKQHNQFQADCSLLMRKKLHPSGWNAFKADILSNIKDPSVLEEVQEKFVRVDRMYKALEEALLLKSLKVACYPILENNDKVPQKCSLKMENPADIGRWKKTVEEISANINVPDLKEKVVRIVEQIKVRNPNVDIWASNLLHEEIKQKSIRLEEIRTIIREAYFHLKFARNEEEFLNLYEVFKNQIIEGFKKILLSSSDPLIKTNIMKFINEMAANVLDVSQAKEGQQAFLERAILHDRKRELEIELRNLETWRNLQQELERVRKLRESSKDHGAALDKKIVSIVEMIQGIEREIFLPSSLLFKDKEILEKISGQPQDWVAKLIKAIENEQATKPKTIQDLKSNFDNIFRVKVNLLKNLEKEAKIFEKEANLVSLKVKGLSTVLDRLLYEIQSFNSRGLYFAQEPLITEGGFATVVRGMQGGSLEPLTFNQCVQAFNEVCGYHYNHQTAHGVSGSMHAKMIEVSKYTDRALTIIGFIKERADKYGIKQPDFSQDLADIKGTSYAQQLDNLNSFIKKAYSLRSNSELSSSAKETEIEKTWTAIYSKKSKKFDINTVNQIIHKLSTTLQGWYESLPEEFQDVFYK